MTNPNQTREEFYELLGQTFQKITRTDKVIILGDFNARIGDDFTSWPIALGKFGRNKSNSNGEQLLSICTHFNLSITNTSFKMSDHWYYSWQHPDRQETGSCATCKQNLNCTKKATSNSKCMVGQES